MSLRDLLVDDVGQLDDVETTLTPDGAITWSRAQPMPLVHGRGYPTRGGAGDGADDSAGRDAERGDIDADFRPVIAEQRGAIERQRAELDRLDAELTDLDHTVRAAGRARHTKEANSMSSGPIRVLFVCTGNSARSQLGEALVGEFGGVDFEAHSAGTEPGGVNPYAVRVLAGFGIDWSGARSKSVTEFIGQPWDYVITVCDRARQTCPVLPGKHNSLHWGLDDPAEIEGTDAERLAAFERTASELAARLRPFIELARRAPRGAASA